MTASLLLACGGPTDPFEGLTCTPPAASGCAFLFGTVLAPDGAPAEDAGVRVEPPDSLPSVERTSTSTDPDGAFRVKLRVFGALPDSAPVRVVAFQGPVFPSDTIDQADTADVVLHFAPHGQSPRPAEVRLRLPPP